MCTLLVGRNAEEAVIQTQCWNPAAPKFPIIIRLRLVWAAHGSAHLAMSAPSSKWPVMKHMAFHLLLGLTTKVMGAARLTFFIFTFLAIKLFPELLVSVCNLLLGFRGRVRTKQPGSVRANIYGL